MPACVTHQGPVNPSQPISSPHSPLGTSPTTTSGASSPSLVQGIDDLAGSLLNDEDGSSPASLFYEHWAPIILECTSTSLVRFFLIISKKFQAGTIQLGVFSKCSTACFAAYSYASVLISKSSGYVMNNSWATLIEAM